MGIKLFLKHLFTSIRKRPLQPILLVLVITVAVMSCITIFNLQDGIDTELDYENTLSLGNADFIVQSNSISSSRFISVSSARQKLGSDINVCGIFGMPLFTENNQSLYACVTELKEASKVFPFFLQSDVSLPEENLSSACLLSKETASELHLAVGDVFSVNNLGTKKDLTVYGISAYPFINSYGIMIDSSAFLSSLADDSLYLTFIDYDFPIATALYIKGNTSVEQLKALYPDMTVLTRENEETVMFGSEKMFLLMVVLAILFVILVIYCCCHILSNQRKEETYLFACVGAKSSSLYLVSVLEIAFYALLGSIFGTLLSLPVGRLAVSVCKLTHSTPSFHVGNVLLSVVSVFGASEGSLFLHILISEYKKRSIRKKKQVKNRSTLPILCGILFALFVATFVTVCVLPLRDKWVPGILSFFFIMLFLFFFGKEASYFVPLLFARKKRTKPSIVYAFKNIRHIDTLQNSMGIATVFFTSIFFLIFLLISCVRGLSFFEEFLQADYILEASVDRSVLLETDGVKSVAGLLRERIAYEDDTVLLMATDRLDTYSARAGMTELPQGNNAFVCGPFADYYELEIGDTFTVTLGDKTMLLYYQKRINLNNVTIFIDADYWGIPYTYQFVSAEDGYDTEQLYENLMATLSNDAVTIMPAKTIAQSITGANKYYTYCGTFTLIVIAFFSVVGMGDNILSCYRSRREEFCSYSIAGMDKTTLRAMKRNEIVYIYLIGFILFLFFSAAVLFSIYETALGFMMDILYSLR